MDRHVRGGGYDVEGIASDILDVYPLTIGIIGLGRIGLEVARRAKGFDIEVLYHDLERKGDVERKFGLRYVALDELLSSSDVVTIHVPLNPKTRGLIGEREISMMKRHAIIINTARGQIIEEEPLYRALIEGRIGGAGLSTLWEEPPTPDCLFYKLGDRLPNVVLMPHIGVGRNTGRTMALTAAEDVIAVLEGRPPKYPLNKDLQAS